MRSFVRVSLIAAMLAAALWSPRRSAADDDSSTTPQVTDEQRQRVATHATHIAKALGQSGLESGLGSGPKAPKAGKRVVATHQSAKKTLDGTAPPAVLGDIASAPTSWTERAKSLIPGSQAAQIVSWLAANSTDEDDRAVSDAFDYYRLNTEAGHGASDMLRPTKGQSDGRANFAETGEAYAVTIPLKEIKGYHDEQWRVTFRNDQRGAPVEVMALLIGHELGVHANDTESDFLSNPGSQIPSELRAFVMDAKNYLEIREQLSAKNSERLAQLRTNPVWQLGDLKARIILHLPIEPAIYADSIGQKTKTAADAKKVWDLKAVASDESGRALSREYIKMRYNRSGETGFEKMYVMDDSPIGKYNQETDRLIQTISAGEYPSMAHGF